VGPGQRATPGRAAIPSFDASERPGGFGAKWDRRASRRTRETAASRGPEPKPRQAEAGTASSRAAGGPTRRRGPTIFSLPRAPKGAEFPRRSGRQAGEEGDRCVTRPGDGPRHPAFAAEAAFGDGCGGPLRSSWASNDDAPRYCRGTEAAPLAQAIGRPVAKPTPRRVHARTSRRRTSQLRRRCSGLDFGPKEPDETGGSVETPARDIATKLLGSEGPGLHRPGPGSASSRLRLLEQVLSSIPDLERHRRRAPGNGPRPGRAAPLLRRPRAGGMRREGPPRPSS